jgi:phospholipase/carboxylesterase
MFHGAGGAAEQGLRLVRSQADARGALVLSIKSTRTTWDVITDGGFGSDLQRLEAALTYAVAAYPVDPRRMAVGGFSDGASYALSVGLTNGDLFGQVIAFSPGFVAADRHHGKPRIFISHGDQDTVLSIDATSRRLVPRLRKEYVVEYVEFHGGHGVPADVAERAIRWWLPD